MSQEIMEQSSRIRSLSSSANQFKWRKVSGELKWVFEMFIGISLLFHWWVGNSECEPTAPLFPLPPDQISNSSLIFNLSELRESDLPTYWHGAHVRGKTWTQVFNLHFFKKNFCMFWFINVVSLIRLYTPRGQGLALSCILLHLHWSLVQSNWSINAC